MHLNSDDFFIGMAREDRNKQVAVLEEMKQEQLKQSTAITELQSLMEQNGVVATDGHQVGRLLLSGIKKLLKLKLQARGEKLQSSVTRKSQMIDLWNTTPFATTTAQQWTEEEESQLQALMVDEIAIEETALGVATQQMARAVANNADHIPESLRNLLREALGPSDEPTSNADV